MPVVMTVLKPFVFSKPAAEKGRVPTEIKFHPERDPETGRWKPTDLELPDEVAAHPWVALDFADGAIESPAQAAERAKVLAAQKIAADTAAEKINKQSELALARATGKAAVDAAAGAAVVSDLDTPVNVLAAKSGHDVDTPNGPVTVSEADLNTPVNVLATKAADEAAPATEEVARPAANPKRK